MEDDEINVVHAGGVRLQGLFDDGRQAFEREIKDLRPVHVEVVLGENAAGKLLIFFGIGVERSSAAAVFDDKVSETGAIGPQGKFSDPPGLVGLDNRGRPGIAEDKAVAAVFGADEFGVGFGRDQEDMAGHAGRQEAFGDGQAVYIARTSQVNVKGGRIYRQAELMLEDAGGGGKEIIRALRAENEGIDSGSVVSVQDLFAGPAAQIKGGFGGSGDVALFDADFFFVFLDIPVREFVLELVVCEDVFG